MNWHDAQAHARWLSERTGRAYRLPSEAEWECAARAGTRTAYWFGDTREQICRYVNLGDRATDARFQWSAARSKYVASEDWKPEPCDDGFATRSPVGALPPNAFGLYGMLGNAMEWTEDCWHDDYRDEPADQAARVTSGDCGERVVRGQRWAAIAGSARSACRRKMNPTDRRFAFGIRLVRPT